jgi:LmbE family N-acetylglucosaminyl deacetylase
MKRKEFIRKGLASGLIIGSPVIASYADPKAGNQSKTKTKTENPGMTAAADVEELVVERSVPGKPHNGKVLLAIQAHSDDIPLFAGGLTAKLMDEGYTGYLLRTSDDKIGNYEGNREDNINIAKFYGMKKAYDFLYPHHQMDAIQIQDLKGRLIFLFRLLKVDTLISWDPWERYDENPDHIATGHAVEAARWMAGGRGDYPEHFDAGLEPHSPREVYYYSRTPYRANRVVDISNYIDKKVEANMLNVTKGPAGSGQGKRLYELLAKEGKHLPILGSEEMADFNYVKHFVFAIDARRLNFTAISNRELGERYGLEWAEWYKYIDHRRPNLLEDYIKENARNI